MIKQHIADYAKREQERENRERQYMRQKDRELRNLQKKLYEREHNVSF